MRYLTLALMVVFVNPPSGFEPSFTQCSAHGQDKDIWAPVDTVRQIDFEKLFRRMDESASPAAQFVLVDSILALERVAVRHNAFSRAEGLLGVAETVLREIDRAGTKEDRHKVKTLSSKIRALKAGLIQARGSARESP
jgi:hypothetical protein